VDEWLYQKLEYGGPRRKRAIKSVTEAVKKDLILVMPNERRVKMKTVEHVVT